MKMQRQDNSIETEIQQENVDDKASCSSADFLQTKETERNNRSTSTEAANENLDKPEDKSKEEPNDDLTDKRAIQVVEADANQDMKHTNPTSIKFTSW